eukprot:symbB.v1.2.030228.t1/scaffold3384.1/size57931/4
MSDGRKFGCWGKGPGVKPPPRVELLVEPANTIHVKKINWEVRSRGNAPKAIERWLASVPSRHVPYATLGYQIVGEPGYERDMSTTFSPAATPTPELGLVRAASAPGLNLASIAQRARMERTMECRKEALHAFRFQQPGKPPNSHLWSTSPIL